MRHELQELVVELREQAHQIESPYYTKKGKWEPARAFKEIADKIEQILAISETQPACGGTGHVLGGGCADCREFAAGKVAQLT